MAKIRVHALAKELGISSSDLLKILEKIDIQAKSNLSSLDEKEVSKVKQAVKSGKQTAKAEATKAKKSPAKNSQAKKTIDQPKEKKEKSSHHQNTPKKQKNVNSKTSGDGKNKKESRKGPQNTHQRNEVKNKSIDNKKQDKATQSNKKANKNDKQSTGDVKNTNDQRRKKRKPHRTGKTAREKQKQKEKELREKENTEIRIQVPISVKDFAEETKTPVAQVITKLMGLGLMMTQNESLDEDLVILLGDELGKEIIIEEPEEVESIEESYNLDYEDNPNFLKSRPPVVTVMGHVDHGKTSLLDVIKQSRVTEGEAGGITQHIGAYMVNVGNKKVTFLDTPGHEAFTAMRLRGAQSTDIAILVVAADDGVMPQTVEAINHARAANVPIIVAITKIDKDTANPERVYQELSEYELIPEAWGGDTIMVPVSSKTKEGIQELLEMVLLVAEMQELKANPNRRAVGTVVEAQLDKGKGPMATILVQKGTLRFGDSIVSGQAHGRIRAMTDDKHRNVKKAGPSTPVVVLGLNEVPNAGDQIYAVEDDKLAREIAEKNIAQDREEKLTNSNKVSLDNLFDRIKEGELKDLNIIVKADVKGSVEAVCQSLLKLSNEEVKINIIHQGAGGINEGDINLASASDALVIGFNVRPNINALDLAKEEEVDVRTYRVIYDIINDVKAAVSGMLDPDIVEEVTGRAEVRQTFKLPGRIIVAGIYVVKGKMVRNGRVKILRDDIVIHEGDIASLKRFKDDAKEIATGFEGGLGIENFNDIKEGDVLECYILKEIKKEL
ncbi:MAG: translation initiation factor IF-2 [Peptoniphilus sp. oral taxon 375]|uniref:translation initiation factor IF-2 n=1 Tax=Urinicoccus timonensis TaxID=2024205 RepID=UPI000C07F1B1|nr:translation initiation factor IF-2 [Urinicoccus timonensis]MBS4871314.1 translation initiation factor IF-2 [Peptoniphilus sp. oral taxon 375]